MTQSAGVLLFSAISLPVFVPYFAGITILVLGFAHVLRNEPRAPGAERVVQFGSVLYAAPMAVFGGEHLTAAKEISALVPHWIPYHMFWTYLVGVALLAAALSIAVKRVAGLASTLLGFMLFCFVVLIGVPGLAANPTNRFSIALVLRDLAFSAGALALASTFATDQWRRAGRTAAVAARYIVGVTVLFWGVEHFLHPHFVPVVPLELPLPAWIPFHFFWAYAVGAALVCGGISMLTNWHARRAAAWMGIVTCVVVLLVYLPILAAHPSDIGVAMNYFADTLAVGGNLLIVASSMPKNWVAVSEMVPGEPSARKVG